MDTVQNLIDIIEGDILHAGQNIGDKVTPAPDGIPAKVLKLILPIRGDDLARFYQGYLVLLHFPIPWKKGKLITILQSLR